VNKQEVKGQRFFAYAQNDKKTKIKYFSQTLLTSTYSIVKVWDLKSIK
jgi:hypothetical protein